MTEQLGEIRAAYPGFTVAIVPGRHEPVFEAVRATPAEGLYAVLTADASELRSILDAADDSGSAHNGNGHGR